MYSQIDDLKKKERKINIQPYIQSTDHTCVAASLLMCLNYFFPNVFNRDKENEMMLHDKIKFWEGDAGEYGSYPKLAKYALNLGLNVRMNLVGPSKPSFIPSDTWNRYMDNFLPILDSLKENPRFELYKKDFNVFNLLNELERGYIPIAEIKYPISECTHHVVIRGFSNSQIKILDPLVGYRSIDFQNMNDTLNLGYMKNFISLHKPDGLELKLIAKGLGASKGDITARASVSDRYLPNFSAGNALVSPRTDPDMIPNMIISSGIATDQGGLLCHAAIVARELGIPAVVGTGDVTKKIQDNQIIHIDGDNGLIHLISENGKSISI